MTLTRDDAWAHLCEWTETESLRRHARAVEIVMRAAAHRYGAGEADVEAWGIAGMLHYASLTDHAFRMKDSYDFETK
ncbi:MAG: hypothetical protein V3T22_10260, partial [Planctomycetota bacterium]